MLTEIRVRQALSDAALEPFSAVIKALEPESAAVELDADVYLYPASMLKTPLAAAALELVHLHELRLDQLFVVTEWNMTANDAQSPFVPGFRGPLSLIIERALTHSDNVATNMLYDICNRERATQIVQEKLRLLDTAFYRKLSGSEPLITDPEWDGLHRNRHSARDAARLFELIATDALPYSTTLREMLGRQQFNDKLSGGLHPRDRFAHKTGDTDEVTHDGGILSLPDGKRYVIVIYTGLESTPEHNARFAPFMRAIRPLL
jgi:beta-lactamase class A